MPDSVLWDTVCGLLPPGPQRPRRRPRHRRWHRRAGRAARCAGSPGHRRRLQPGRPGRAGSPGRRVRACEGSLTALQGDADDLQVDAGAFDLALCHGLLEHVDDPAVALAGIVRALRPGGRLSLVVAQRSAAVVGTALAGHLARAEALLDDPAGRWGDTDPLARRFDRAEVVGLVEAAGLAVDAVHGLRVLGDLVPGQLLESDPAARARLLALDARLAGQPDYAGLAAALHVLARRSAARSGPGEPPG